jgi:uncharacterized protein (TIGR00730 family)
MTKSSVAVFGSSQALPNSPAYRLAADLGRALARRGMTVRCGGYSGVMEGVAVGAREAGGRVVGCTLDWFADTRTPGSHLDEVRPSPDLASRLSCLLEGTRAAVALPGGVGTLNEVFWLWTLLFHGRGERRDLVLLGESWKDLCEFLYRRFEFPQHVQAMTRVTTDPEEAALLASGAGRS